MKGRSISSFLQRRGGSLNLRQVRVSSEQIDCSSELTFGELWQHLYRARASSDECNPFAFPTNFGIPGRTVSDGTVVGG